LGPGLWERATTPARPHPAGLRRRRAGSRKRRLVVDDDASLRELLTELPAPEGFDVSGVEDGTAMFDWLEHTRPIILILDLMLPGDDGLTLARRLRTQTEMPIIMLSARGEDIDRIVGLEVGADDYLAKPFNPRELLARIRAVLRRHAGRRRGATGPADSRAPSAPTGSTRGPQLLRDGKPVTLTGSEFDLLRIFVEHPNRMLDRDRLLDLLKGYERNPFDRSIDVQVARLRPRSSRTRSSRATSAPSGAEATCSRPRRGLIPCARCCRASLFGSVLLTLVLTFGSFAVITFATSSTTHCSRWCSARRPTWPP
jgi:DNA-binding response OmpR family regulator